MFSHGIPAFKEGVEGGVKTKIFQKGCVCVPPTPRKVSAKNFCFGLSRAWLNACMYVYMYVRKSKIKGCAIPSLG